MYYFNFSVRDEWKNITDFEDSTNPQSAADSTRHLIGILNDLDGGVGGKPSSRSSSSSSGDGINVVCELNLLNSDKLATYKFLNLV